MATLNLILAIFGLVLALLDFLGLASAAERFFDGARSAAWRSAHRVVRLAPWISFFALLAFVVAAFSPSHREVIVKASAIALLAVLLLFALFLLVMLLSVPFWLIDKSPRGTFGSLGLILAGASVLLAY